MNVALVGCGNIAGHYAKRITALEPLRLVGVTDTVSERAEALAAEHGVRRFASLEELLGDDEVELVVNLTVPAAHAPVTTAALEAGKHVHSEKPLALTYDEARELVELSRRTDRRLSCSPATLLGEAAHGSLLMGRVDEIDERPPAAVADAVVGGPQMDAPDAGAGPSHRRCGRHGIVLEVQEVVGQRRVVAAHCGHVEVAAMGQALTCDEGTQRTRGLKPRKVGLPEMRLERHG